MKLTKDSGIGVGNSDAPGTRVCHKEMLNAKAYLSLHCLLQHCEKL